MHKINVRPLACFLSLAVITAFVTPITVNSIALTTEHVAEMADDNPSNIGITRSIEDRLAIQDVALPMPEPVDGVVLEVGPLTVADSRIFYVVNHLVPMSVSVVASRIYMFENDESSLLYESTKEEAHPPFGGISQLETNGKHLVWVEVSEPWTLMVMDLESGKTKKVLTTDDEGQGELFAITLINDVVYWYGEHGEDGVIYAYSLASDELTIYTPKYPLHTLSPSMRIPNSMNALFYLVELEQGPALACEKRDDNDQKECLFPLASDQIFALAVSDTHAAWADSTLKPTLTILDFESGEQKTIDIALTAIRSMAFLGENLLLDATFEGSAVVLAYDLGSHVWSKVAAETMWLRYDIDGGVYGTSVAEPEDQNFFASVRRFGFVDVSIFMTSRVHVDLTQEAEAIDVKINDFVLTEDMVFVATNDFSDGRLVRSCIQQVVLADRNDVRIVYTMETAKDESFNGARYLRFAGERLFFVVRRLGDWKLLSVSPDQKEVTEIAVISELDQDHFQLFSDGDVLYWQDGARVFAFSLSSGDVTKIHIPDGDLIRLVPVSEGVAVNAISAENSVLLGLGVFDDLQVDLPGKQVVLTANDRFVLHEDLSLVDHSLFLTEIATARTESLILPEGVQAIRCGYFIGDYAYLQAVTAGEPVYVWSAASREWYEIVEANLIAALKHAPINLVYGMTGQEDGHLDFVLIK